MTPLSILVFFFVFFNYRLADFFFFSAGDIKANVAGEESGVEAPAHGGRFHNSHGDVPLSLNVA